MLYQHETRRVEDAAGLGKSSFPGGDDNRDNNRNPRCLQAPRYEARFRRQIKAIHKLGPYVISCLVEEIAGGADLRETVTTYAALDGSFIAAYGGDRFAPSLLCIDGDGL